MNQPIYRRLLKIVEWTLGPPAVLFGIVASIYGVWGPIWPTVPVFSPIVPSFGSPYDIPFSVSNKSILFPVKNLQIMCHLPFFNDSRQNRWTDTRVWATAANHLPPSTTQSYVCPFSRNIDLGGAQIVDASIDFQMEYDSPWPWSGRVKNTSSIFTLSNTQPRAWTPGIPLR